MEDLRVSASAGLGVSSGNEAAVVSLLAALAAALGLAVLPLEVVVDAVVLAIDPLVLQSSGCNLIHVRLWLCSSYCLVLNWSSFFTFTFFHLHS